MSVFLCRDAWGSPSATQTYLGTVAPTEWFKKTNKSVVSLVVAGRVPVVQGLDYWLVLKPAVLETLPGLASNMIDSWNFSLPEVSGLTAYSHDGGAKWWPSPRHVLPAFGITAWPPPWADFFRAQPGGFYHP